MRMRNKQFRDNVYKMANWKDLEDARQGTHALKDDGDDSEPGADGDRGDDGEELGPRKGGAQRQLRGPEGAASGGQDLPAASGGGASGSGVQLVPAVPAGGFTACASQPWPVFLQDSTARSVKNGPSECWILVCGGSSQFAPTGG